MLSPAPEAILRPFQSADASAVTELALNALVSAGLEQEALRLCRPGSSLSPPGLLRLSKREYILVVQVEHDVVGVGSLWQNRISLVFVSPGWQRRNLGRRIVEHLETMASRRGENRVRLVAYSSAVPFYERLGYLAERVVQLEAHSGLEMFKALLPWAGAFRSGA